MFLGFRERLFVLRIKNNFVGGKVLVCKVVCLIFFFRGFYSSFSGFVEFLFYFIGEEIEFLEVGRV